ncbi:MAG: TolC family protein, partial [Balneolaceae bacterium]
MKKNHSLSKGVITCLLLVVFITLPFFTIQTHSQSLADYLEIAAENNPEIQSAFYRYQAALQEVPIRGALDDPEIGFGYFVRPVETRVGAQEARISLTQMLPWFGTLSQRKTVAATEARVFFEEFQEQRNRLFFTVQERWYEIYFMEQSIDILNQNIQILETFESAALQNYESATGRQVDVLRVQIELEELRNQLHIHMDELDVLKTDFNNILNRDPSLEVVSPDQIDSVAVIPETDDLYGQILAQNPSLQQLEYKSRARQDEITLARKLNRPSFYVGLDYTFVSERPVEIEDNGKDAFMLRGSVKVPIFRNRNQARVEQARQLEKSINYAKEEERNRLLTNLETALKDLRNADRNLKLASNVQIRYTEQAVEMLL